MIRAITFFESGSSYERYMDDSVYSSKRDLLNIAITTLKVEHEPLKDNIVTKISINRHKPKITK